MDADATPAPAPDPTSTLSPIAAVSAIVGPALLIASTLASITIGLDDPELGGALQFWSFLAIGIAVSGLARTVERAAPATAAALGALAFVVAGVGVGFGVDRIQQGVFDAEPLVLTGSGAVGVTLLAAGLGAPATLLLLGVTLARTGAVPKVLGATLAAGAVLFPLSRIPDIEILAVISDLLILAALGAIGVRRLQRRGLVSSAA